MIGKFTILKDKRVLKFTNFDLNNVHLINIISSSTDSLKIEDENYDNLQTSTVVIKKA